MIDLEHLAEKLYESGCTEGEIETGVRVAEMVIERFTDALLMRWTEIELQRIARQVASRRRR